MYTWILLPFQSHLDSDLSPRWRALEPKLWRDVHISGRTRHNPPAILGWPCPGLVPSWFFGFYRCSTFKSEFNLSICLGSKIRAKNLPPVNSAPFHGCTSHIHPNHNKQANRQRLSAIRHGSAACIRARATMQITHTLVHFFCVDCCCCWCSRNASISISYTRMTCPRV